MRSLAKFFNLPFAMPLAKPCSVSHVRKELPNEDVLSARMVRGAVLYRNSVYLSPEVEVT